MQRDCLQTYEYGLYSNQDAGVSVPDIESTGGRCSGWNAGNFKWPQCNHTEERIGRNPQNKKEMKIPASKKVKFTVGKDLKTAVAGEEA